MSSVDNKVIYVRSFKEEKEILNRPWTIPEAMLLHGTPDHELVEAREQYKQAADGATRDIMGFLGVSATIAGFYVGIYGLAKLLETLGVVGP